MGLLRALFAILGAGALACAAGADEPPPKVSFAAQIEPLLRMRCHKCHGASKAERGLRLDRRTDALAGGDSGRAIEPGDAAASRLMQFVTGENNDEVVMPPDGDSLSAEEIDLLRRWIDEGADWPKRRAVPPL